MAANSKSDDDESLAQGDEKILEDAHARFKLAEDAESDIRSSALDDLQFRAGDQWPDQIKADRALDGRPCLVINRIPQFIQQVTNDQRQNRPSIKVHPVDDKGDVETAKIIQGLIRHIEYNSNADVAYDTAFDGAVTGGFGYLRVVTDYVSPMSFDQEILIKRIRNPFSVFFDPHSQEPDGSDAAWAFIVDDMSKTEYRAQFPDSKLCAQDEWETLGNQKPDWAGKDSCRVAEYFYKEFKPIAIIQAQQPDGQLYTGPKDEMPEGAVPIPGKERVAQVPVIKWCKLNGAEVLEKRDWPGIYIPIIPVYGTELYIEGKRILEGVVRNAKDPQRMYNYWKSAQTEAIALAPRAPFIAAVGQIEGFEDAWANANRRNQSVLEYNPVGLSTGQPMPAPQRQPYEPAVQAITQAAMQAADDLKATTGIYDASLGGKSNETSGVAIQRRNVQSQTSNFHFVDNLTRSLRHLGRIVIDLIPKVIDTARAARIIGEDGEQKIVQVNGPQKEPATDKDGKPVLYQLDVGKYDAVVDVGPSYASKRQEAAASMLEMSKANPAITQIAGDLIVKNMDWPGATEISERLKKTLPPGLADDPNEKDKGKQIPPQIQAQMQHMGQMLEQAAKDRNDLLAEREQRLVEIESKERIEFAKIQSNEIIELTKIDAKDSLALLSAEIASTKHRLDLLNIDVPIEPEAAEPAPGQEMPTPSDGAPEMGGAPVGDEGMQPPGGTSPGQPPMEGNP